MLIKRIAPLSAAVIAAVGLVACSGATEASPGNGASSPAAEAAQVQIEDNHATQSVTVPPANVVATDNRVFQTLSDWGVKLVAAPVDLIESDSPYKSDASVVNLGLHTEPNLEAVVAAEPTLIINGQRFAQHYDALKQLVPEATIVELDPREGQPLDAELRRQITGLGQIFGKETEAAQLIADFDASIKRVKDAYSSDDKVMAVITSGGEINFAAPGSGRTLGPVFDILGLTPALEAEGSSDHQGDDISVEAIAASNPSWILVMDRDAAISQNSDEQYTPAADLISGSSALKNVDAVKEGHVIYMPGNTYLNEGIQTYTAFFNSIADAMEK